MRPESKALQKPFTEHEHLITMFENNIKNSLHSIVNSTVNSNIQDEN